MAGSAVLKGTPGGLGPAEPEDARGWLCSEHGDRVVELFCRRCRRCVCALCPVLGSHRGHPIGLALDEAARVQVGTLGREPRSNGRGGACRVPLAVPGWNRDRQGGPGTISEADLLFRKRLRKGTGEPRPSFKHQKSWVWE